MPLRFTCIANGRCMPCWVIAGTRYLVLHSIGQLMAGSSNRSTCVDRLQVAGRGIEIAEWQIAETPIACTNTAEASPLPAGKDDRPGNILSQLYDRHFYICSNPRSAALGMTTASPFLAQPISLIHAIAALCESSGAKVGAACASITADRLIVQDFRRADSEFAGTRFKTNIFNLNSSVDHDRLKTTVNDCCPLVDLNGCSLMWISLMMVASLFYAPPDQRIAILGFLLQADPNDQGKRAAKSRCRDCRHDGASLIFDDPRSTSDVIEQLLMCSMDHLMLGGDLETAPAEHNACSGVEVVLIRENCTLNRDPNRSDLATRSHCLAWVFVARRGVNPAQFLAQCLETWQIGDVSTL